LFNPITKKTHITQDVVVFYESKYYWRQKNGNKSNPNPSPENKATNQVNELSRNEELIIFPLPRIITVGDDLESELLFICLFIQVYCPYATLGYERPTPIFEQIPTSIRTHKRSLGNYPH
jgi:hypothetical protein